jgi:diguanylate cyclase (GGDEF)-like protein
MQATKMQATTERRQHKVNSLLYADVLVELTELTFRNLIPTIVTGGAGLVGASVLLALHYRDRWLWWLAGIIAAFTIARFVVALRFSRRGDRPLTLRNAQRWQVVYASITLAYAASLAVSTMYNFRAHGMTAWLFCIFSVFIVCASLSGRIGLHPRMAQASGLLMLTALSIAVLSLPEQLARFGVVLVVLFAIFFVRSVEDKFEVILEQLRSRKALRQLAEQDTLTSIANRRHFELTLAAACSAEMPLAILFIDLDGFKQVNDTYGNAVGDITLQRVAVRLRASVRRGDLVARLGGDEFAVLQGEGASQAAAESLARRINRALAAPFEIAGHQIRIGASIGIRVASFEDKDPALLLNDADQALFRVKQAGGGQFASAAFQPPAA